MKTLIDTPQRLVLDHRPLGLAILVSAVAVVSLALGLWRINDDFTQGLNLIVVGLIFGFGINFLVIRRVTITLDRDDGIFSLRTGTILGARSKNWPLDHVDGAELETGSSTKADGTNRHRVEGFVQISGGHDAGAHLLLRPMANATPAKHAVDAINRWCGAQKS